MRWVKVLLVSVLLVAAFSLAAQTQQVLVRDILESPSRYYNLQVMITGEVVDVNIPSSPGERGFYVLMDNSDKKIKIVANTLPAPQTQWDVTGVVQIFPEDQEPFLRELNRVAAGGGCRDGETRTQKCKDGSEIVVARCQNGQWVSTGEQCKAGVNLLLIGLIGLIVVIVGAIIAVILRKPKAPEAPAASMQPPSAAPGAPPVPSAPAAPSYDRTRQVSTAEIERQVGGMKTKQVPSMLAELRVMTGSQSGKSFPLGFETVIGRVRGDVILEDASVSKEHAKIVFLGNKFAVENLSQTNPVILNGEKVQAQKELKSGDEIIVGLIKLQFRLI
ncbi:MAG: FHA domain-containing protein [Candidatus Aminicenantes bacterium]|nr:FHA domain-containing protein [Candidatus Aminicenantes bacterium]